MLNVRKVATCQRQLLAWRSDLRPITEPCGLGIREDSTVITKDTPSFVPHIIEA